MPPGKPKRTRSWTLRYYLCAGDQVLWRITNSLLKEWHDGIAFPELANTKQKILEVFVGHALNDKPVLLDARGNKYSFDSEGKLDIGSAADIVGIVLDESCRIEGNVIDIWPTISRRHWVSEHIWMPTPNMLLAISADLATTARARSGRIATIGRGLKKSKL